MDRVTRQNLASFFEADDRIVLALLFGSRAKDRAHEHSDWDFAIQFEPSDDKLDDLGYKETIRAGLRRLLGAERVDLVDLLRADLSILATVADEGQVLKGEHTLELSRFYVRVWALQEDFYWRKEHA
jgi:predicted nucleotidyltransferase